MGTEWIFIDNDIGYINAWMFLCFGLEKYAQMMQIVLINLY